MLLAGGALLLGGCAALKQNYPDKNRFAPELEREAAPESVAESGVLRVREFSVAPQFSAPGFVYRTGPMEYKTDYYNEFLIPPGALFAAASREWMANSGLFRTVTESDSPVGPDQVLEGNISQLYGNVVPGEKGAAVLEMRFLLFPGTGAGSGEYFQKRYQKDIPLEEFSARGVMEGWNRGLEEILTDLEGELRDYLVKGGKKGKDESRR